MTDRPNREDGPIDDALLDGAQLEAPATVDPTMADPPPDPGSPRYLSILEHAMTPTIDRAPTGNPSSDDCPESATRRPRRRRAFAFTAAALVAVVVGIVVVDPGSDPTPASAAEALAEAAAATGDVTTLRVDATYVRADSTTHLVAEANGTDYRIDAVGTYADGREEHETTVVIGDIVWEDGQSRTVPPEERNAAYAPSSEVVVEAILNGSTLEDLGADDVRGVSARHIRAALTPASRAALAALSPSQVAMFELEYPQGVDTLDLWIADDLIQRISVVIGEGTGEDGEPQLNSATIEFYDFGADISITPPA